MDLFVDVVLIVCSFILGYGVRFYQSTKRKSTLASVYSTMVESAAYQNGYTEGWEAAGNDKDYVEQRYRYLTNPFNNK